MVGNPEINILGAAIGTVVCYVVISALNLLAMARRSYPINLLRTMFKPMLAALLMGAAAWFVRGFLEGRGLSNGLVVIASIAAAGVLYLILVLAFRIIQRGLRPAAKG